MKPVLIILVIIVIIGALNGYAGMYLDHSSSKLLSMLGETKRDIESSNYPAASEQIKALREEWESVESHWEVLVDHREVERIDTLMTHLEAMSATGAWDTIMPELDELSFYVTHINDKEKLRMENIL